MDEVLLVLFPDAAALPITTPVLAAPPRRTRSVLKRRVHHCNCEAGFTIQWFNATRANQATLTGRWSVRFSGPRAESKTDFIAGFYVTPLAQSVVRQGAVVHESHEPGHNHESVRKSNFVPTFTLAEREETHKRLKLHNCDVNSLRLDLLDRGKVLTAKELQQMIKAPDNKRREEGLHDAVFAHLEGTDGVNETGLLQEAWQNDDVVTMTRYSIHSDPNAADNADVIAERDMLVYCEVTLPAKLSSSGTRTTYNVTELVGGSLDNEWSVFDAYVKTPEQEWGKEAGLPEGFKCREIGCNGEHANKTLRLQALVVVRLSEMRRAARCMEAQQIDGTTGIDKSGRCVASPPPPPPH